MLGKTVIIKNTNHTNNLVKVQANINKHKIFEKHQKLVCRNVVFL